MALTKTLWGVDIISTPFCVNIFIGFLGGTEYEFFKI